MQRRKSSSHRQNFRTTAVSDISLPDFNELDVKDLAPVVEAAAPTMSTAEMNNQQMKSAQATFIEFTQSHATKMRPQETG